MERVTLGVVGDPFVGKTMLSVSYTSNYVFKDYTPTVLNCYATTVLLDGRVVDLMIWDNSGSDDYRKLRPLSYPQTDAFLVCFSLKSRTSLENVLTKWLPEIDENVRGRVPIVLVGCKRDKHCGQPADFQMPNGNISRVTPPTHLTDMYPYMTKMHYGCNEGYELPVGVPDVEIECLQSNTWSDFSYNCTKVQCAGFTVVNGNVTFDTTMEYLDKAIVSCHQGYVTSSGHPGAMVYCQHDKTWSEYPICTDGRKSRYFKLHTGMIRVSNGTDEKVRSEIDCAALCTGNTLCYGANYRPSSPDDRGGTCRLFEQPHDVSELEPDDSCEYLELS